MLVKSLPAEAAFTLIAVATVMPAADVRAQQDDRGALFAALERMVPQHGAVEIVFAQSDGRREQRIGFDFATGAWFRASDRMAQGQEPGGESYFGEAGLGCV